MEDMMARIQSLESEEFLQVLQPSSMSSLVAPGKPNNSHQ